MGKYSCNLLLKAAVTQEETKPSPHIEMLLICCVCPYLIMGQLWLLRGRDDKLHSKRLFRTLKWNISCILDSSLTWADFRAATQRDWCWRGSLAPNIKKRKKNNLITNLSAHKDVNEGVVRRARLGKEWWDDGQSGRDHALPAEGLHHGDDSVGCPTNQEAGYHQEKHHGDFLLITQNLDDLNRLEVLERAQL